MPGTSARCVALERALESTPHGRGLSMVTEAPTLKRATFMRLRDIVYDSSGITLPDSKRALLTARTGKRMRALGIRDHELYLEILEADQSGEELLRFLDVVSTNVTGFFREPSHFDVVGDAVRRRLDQDQPRLRLWSAACSTGEEPYSLAMTALEATAGRAVDVRILATDISTRALEVARRGVYPLDKARCIPPMLRQHYGARTGDRREPSWTIADEARRLVTFHRMNLSRPPFPMKGPFDVILCCNVMIYFDQRVREALLTEMHRLLHPDGLLVVGHAESLCAHPDLFSLVQPSIFRRR
jgi:chemotaxis protein methyltransferase CheR